MSEWGSDPRPGDLCLQMAHILDDTDPQTLRLAVNDSHGHIHKEWKMSRDLFTDQFYELEEEKGTWIKRIKIIEKFSNGTMIKFIKIDAKGKEIGEPQILNQKIFRDTYILETLANLQVSSLQPAGDEKIIDLEHEV